VASADGRRLAVAGQDGILRLLDAETGRTMKTFSGASRELRALAFSPDGTRVVASDYSTILVWPTERDALPDRYDVQGGQVLSAEWSTDGSTLVTLGADGAVITLDMTGRRRLGALVTDRLDGHASTMWPLRQAIVIGQFGGRLLFVAPQVGTVKEAEGHLDWAEQVENARAGQQGDLLVTNDARGLTAVWDVATRRLLGTVPLPLVDPAGGPFDPQVWVSPDGTKAATIRDAVGPLVFDPRTRQGVHRLPPTKDAEDAWSLAVFGWTRDGRSLLVAQCLSATKCELLVVDATTGDEKLRIETGTAAAIEATEDPAGRYIAVVTEDGTLLLFDAKDGHPLAPPLQANDGQAYNVSVSPDGRYISTTGSPPRLTIWDTRTFRQVGTPLPIDVNAVEARGRFAPDGRLMVVTGNVLRAFTIDPAAWLARACREAGRILTRSEFDEVLPGRPYDPACR
jgi:WD40 repeat protein